MKKLIIAATLLISVGVTGQQWGLRGGVNFAGVKVEDAEDWESRLGFHTGVLANFNLTPKVWIQPELHFSAQGGESDNDNVKLKLNYLNLPVLFQFRVTEGLRIQTGPQLGFLLSAETKAGDIEIDVEDAFESIDLSWSFGGVYYFNSEIGIDFRYNLGLTNIVDGSGNDAHNRVIQLGTVFMLGR